MFVPGEENNMTWRCSAATIAIFLMGVVVVRSLTGAAGQTRNVAVQRDANSFVRDCPTAADIAAIKRDLRLSFESDPTRGTQVCSAAAGSADLTLMQARAYRSLVAMRDLSFDAPLPWTKDSVYRWLVKAIGGIRFRANIETSFCCDPPNTINVRDTVLGRLPTAAATENFGQLEGFMGLLVHEARHRDGGPHTCGNRDTSIKQLGSWAVQYHFHLWIANHTAPDFMPTVMRDDIRRQAVRLCQEQFCEDRCRDSVEETEYRVMSVAATHVIRELGSVRMVAVSDRTVAFPCESAAETGLVVGDCNGMRTARQSPEQALTAIRKSMPAVGEDMTASFLIGASKSFSMESRLDLPVPQTVWGPGSDRGLPQGALPPDLAIYPSRVGYNQGHDAALVYLGVRDLSGKSKSFGEYIFLTKTNIQWTVKGRARVWEALPATQR